MKLVHNTLLRQKPCWWEQALAVFFILRRPRETPLGVCLRVIVNELHPNVEKTTSSVLSGILINLWHLIKMNGTANVISSDLSPNLMNLSLISNPPKTRFNWAPWNIEYNTTVPRNTLSQQKGWRYSWFYVRKLIISNWEII